MPGFYDQIGKVGASGKTCTDGFAQKKWVFARFYFKSGQPETIGAQGFPTFFSYLMRRKNIKIIYNWRKKVGFWAESKKTA